MSHDALAAVADAVLQHIRNSRGAVAEGELLVALPTYLDAVEARFLQMEFNRHTGFSVELQYRLGEQRVGVRLMVLPQRFGTGCRS